jgi:hypothetical protein
LNRERRGSRGWRRWTSGRGNKVGCRWSPQDRTAEVPLGVALLGQRQKKLLVRSGWQVASGERPDVTIGLLLSRSVKTRSGGDRSTNRDCCV